MYGLLPTGQGAQRTIAGQICVWHSNAREGNLTKSNYSWNGCDFDEEQSKRGRGDERLGRFRDQLRPRQHLFERGRDQPSRCLQEQSL